jgi:hypothetical protein
VVAPAIPYNQRSRSFGSYGTATRLYKADRFGNITGEIDPQDVVSGSITHSDDDESVRKFSFELVDHRLVNPFRDYVIPEITLSRPDGTVQSSTFGLFMLEMPKTEFEASHRLKGTIEGKDLTYLLSRSTMPLTTYPVGRDIGSICREIARGAGFVDSQLALPDTGYTLGTAYKVQPGDNRLETMNALYAMAGWHAVSMSSECKLSSRKIELLQYRPASRTYSNLTDIVEILPGITSEQDTTEWFNKVTVRKVGTEEGEATIHATARITNVNHPLYYNPANPSEGFGMELAAPTIDNSDIETEAAARDLALAELAKKASKLSKIRISTVVDVFADSYDVIGLDIWTGDYQVHGGKWWRDGWTIAIDGVVGTIDSTLYRVEDVV